jgi:ParB/RepB/Spo0J family partition protein
MGSLTEKLAARQVARTDGQDTATQASAIMARMREDQIDRDSVILLCAQIEEDLEQARKTFDGIEDLAASIETQGQDHAVIVIPTDNPHRFKLHKGARRLRAIRDVLKRDTIRATIRRDPGNELAWRLGQVHENVQRADYKPLEIADELQRLLDLSEEIHGERWAQRELARQLGINQSWISKRLSLLTAPPEIRAAIESGELAETDYYNDKTSAATTVATKREKPDGADQTPKAKKLTLPWENAVALAELLIVLGERTGLSDLVLSPEPTKAELLALLARVDAVRGTL